MSRPYWSEIFKRHQPRFAETADLWEQTYRTHITDVSNETSLYVESRSASTDVWTLPSEAYAVARVRVLDAAGAAIVAGVSHGLLNGPSLFSNAQLLFNGIDAEECREPGFVGLAMSLLESEEDYKMHGSIEQIFFDEKNGGIAAATATPGDAADLTEQAAKGAAESAISLMTVPVDLPTTLLYLAADAAQNPAQVQRSNARLAYHATTAPTGKADASGYMYVKIPLKRLFGICRSNIPVRGLQLQLKLQKQTDIKLNTLSTVAAAGTIEISRLSIVVPHARANVELFADLNSKLVASTPYYMDYLRFYSTKVTGLTGSELSHRVLSNTKRPRYVIAAINQGSRDRTTQRNSLIFDRPASVRGQVLVGGRMYPQMPYDSDSDGFLRMYNAFMALTGKDNNASETSFLSFDRWKDVYPLKVFDVSHNNGAFEEQADAEIVFDLKFTTPPLESYNLYCLVISEESKKLWEEGSTLRIESTA